MSLAEIVREIESLKSELDEFRPIDEIKLNRLNQKLKLDWNYHSNKIEGNTLSESETKSFLLTGITAKGKPFRDYLEMKGHNDALTKLYKIVDGELLITESLIKEFHKMILVEPYSSADAEVNPGEWKKFPNYLLSVTGERVDFAPPTDVAEMMNSLINWLNNQIAPPKRKKHKYDLHPLLISASFHQQFIDIHPFGDGNGRMARILTNLILMLCNYVPIIVQSEDREAYYQALNSSSATNPQEISIFFGKQLIKSLKMTLEVAKGNGLESQKEIDNSLKNLNDEINKDL